LDQFVLGMLAGCVYSGRAPWQLPRWIKHWSLAPIAFAAPLWTVYGYNRLGGYLHLGPSNPFWIVWPDLEASAWLVFVLVYLKSDFDWPRPISRALGWLGTLSFSLYVNHWLFVADFPAYKYLGQFTKSFTDFSVISFTVFLLPFLVLFSWLTYQVIEKPFFELRRLYIRKPKPDESTALIVMPDSAMAQTTQAVEHKNIEPRLAPPNGVVTLDG